MFISFLLLVQQIFATRTPAIPAQHGVIVEYRNRICSYTELDPSHHFYPSIHPLCLLEPPDKWPLVSKTAFYYDATKNECVKGSAGLTSWCSAFVTKERCESKCINPKNSPKPLAQRNVIDAFESSQQLLECKPKRKTTTCSIILGRIHTCECEEKSRQGKSTFTTMDPHVTNL
ncbi:hypothetical protein DSO57_1022406 [Entomophthora muscae]|uniref:Uncharacterized protein n=1 Tax=Entomophthora muscae TaxID=34485 RepID=A0ACC2RHU5_9FUNG|nr:hypothetical protein DSO57_1022406 [Entomophthora muscae]